MRDLSQLTCGFVDHGGLYQPLAQCMARACKRLLYWDPKEEAFESVNDAIIGDSFPPDERFERIGDIWLDKNECDFFVFPDSKGAGMQIELASQGFPVWGGRRSQFIEESRETFIKLLKENGLSVPPYQRIIGLANLRDYLKDHDNQIVKVSKYRGTMETFKWRSMDDGEAWLDLKAVELGGVKNLLPFLVFESVDTPLELGGDTYSVLGAFPQHMLDGYEWKDKGYFGAFKPVSDMPEPTQAVMAAFGPILKRTGHIGFWSMEIRKPLEGDDFFFIDPTPRGPLPGTASQIALYKNLPQVIAAGAEGELVEPEAVSKFAAECVLTTKATAPAMQSVRVPAELEGNMFLSGTVRVHGREWFPQSESRGEEIGWLAVTGDTPRETIEAMLDTAKKLPEGVDAHTESLVDLLKEIHEAEDQGIEFTSMPVPEPESVVTADE